MSTNRNPRSRRGPAGRRPHRARRPRALTLSHGDQLAALPPLIRIAQCSSGKRRYFSYEDAELILAGLDRSHPKRRECRVYECSICSGWHLTSQEFQRNPIDD